MEDNYDELVQRIANHLTEKDYKQAVKLVRRADVAAGTSNDIVNVLSGDEQVAYYMALLRSYLLLSKGCKDSNDELQTQIKTVQFLEDSVNFAKIVNIAVPKILEMLQSKVNSDVFEAVDFFTYGYMFGVRGTEVGMRRMLYLVWSTEKEKSEAVANAYKKVLFTTDLTGRAHAIKVVKNLCNFMEDLEAGHYVAFEFLVKEWVKTEDIDLLMIQCLFEVFTRKFQGSTHNDSRLALQLLIIASSEKNSIASANLHVIETVGIGDFGQKDARVFCGCLEFYINSIDSNVVSKYYSRYDKDDEESVIHKITSMYIKFFMQPRTPDFDKVTTKVIEFFYHLCQSPDLLVSDVIKQLHNKMIKTIKMMREMQENVEVLQTQESSLEKSDIEDILTQPMTQSEEPKRIEFEKGPKYYLPTYILTRFLYFVGCATLKELIFLDIDIYNNMKYREELKKEKSKSNKNKNKAGNYNKRKTIGLDISASGTLKRLSTSAAEPQQEPDEDLVGATAEDNIAELVQHICENIILYDQSSILPEIIPIVLEICKYPSKYRDEVLQQTSCVTLTRFMTVSSKFCEDHMSFLMNILKLTTNPKIKCNILVGLSDLTFRYPNIIEPWTVHLYLTLHEENVDVRLTAVKILSHLILHEMIRVKGLIADLAVCIVDQNDDIKNITKNFFNSIAAKCNILYNVLPDIISRLGDGNMNLEEENYQIIMKYIIGLIQKDRQVETLVERLCARFKITKEERQWREVAYCLSLLSYNEKTMKKLTDNIPNFKDKVQVDEVYNYFKLIISNTNKLAKPELKAVVSEFENNLNKCFHVGGDGEGESTEGGEGTQSKSSLSQVPSTSSQRGKRSSKVAVKKVPTRGGRGRNRPSDSESSAEERGGGRKGRTSQRGKPNKITQVIEESSSSEEESVPQRKRGRRRN